MKKILLSMFGWLLTVGLVAQNNPAPFIGTNLARGTELRVLRLAVSSVGEFTQSVAGNNDREKVEEVLRQTKAWLKEINETYGREYCVRFELLPDSELRKIIFTNAGSDPWPSMSGAGCDGAGKIHSVQGTVIDEIIGAENYDFSHVIIHNYNGGCAGGFKRGYSGGFNIGITRHEMGHQFSQGHTINNGGNTNYEPENAGKSIHGGNTHPYAHSASYHQLANHLLEREANAGSRIPTGNQTPTVDAGADRAIPVGTPFTLTAIAHDSDRGDQLTYAWDQLDRGIPKKLPSPNDLEGALFSRLLPSQTPTRTFPTIENVIANNFSTELEQLPTNLRNLNFRLTVNDNHQFNYRSEMVNASGINSDDVKLTVVNNGGAFKVISQRDLETYTGGSRQLITWLVSGTNQAPINTQYVRISLSTNGGQSFPIILSENTPNNGRVEVSLPNMNTTQARIKVEAIDNYFFAINSQDFTINQNRQLPGLSVVSSSTLFVSETGRTANYTVGLLTNPTRRVQVRVSADSQTGASHFVAINQNALFK